jgi:hypothetical protein
MKANLYVPIAELQQHVVENLNRIGITVESVDERCGRSGWALLRVELAA